MSGIIGALLHATNYRTPFLRTLVPSIGLAYGIQAAVAIPSIFFQTERYYDLSGSLTYLSCTALSLTLPLLRARYAAGSAAALPGVFEILRHANWRQLALSAAVTFWAARLGSFLFARISSENGRDSRFDGLRESTPKFFGAFAAQATWVSLCLLPVLAVNSIPAAALAALPAVTLTDVLGLLLYVGGITFEATADRQKSRWMEEKKAKKHSEEFLTHGLWSKSRHPNYFGESTLWTGIATTAAGVMLSGAGQAGMGLSGGLLAKVGVLAMAGVSPAFVTFLLLKVCDVECRTSIDPCEANENYRFLVSRCLKRNTTSVMETVRIIRSGRRTLPCSFPSFEVARKFSSYEMYRRIILIQHLQSE